MKKIITFLGLILFSVSASFAQKYVFYLHGRIVEGNCDHAIDVTNGFGEYKYKEILYTFRKEKFVVISECRPANTDVKEYAHKVVAQIDSLIAGGASPSSITVIGASKGSMIAMYVSSFLQNKDVNYVFMSACSEGNFNNSSDLNFCGNILSIYEKSDVVGTSCGKYKNKSTQPIPHYKEIELNTGLRHGYLYKPLPEWVKPAVKWASGNY